MKRMGMVVALFLLACGTPTAGAQAPALPPLPPDHLEASYDAAQTAYVLSWEAPGNGSYSYDLYRSGAIVYTGTDTSYADVDFGSFNLYYVTATDANGTSPPSSPVGIVTCGTVVFNPLDCQPDSAQQAAAWRSYAFVEYQNGILGICDIADVNLFPFGYAIYWDCIQQIVHIGPNVGPTFAACTYPIRLNPNGSPCIP